MNSQQAINLLNGLEQSLDDYCELNGEGKTAFRMAITALELFRNAEHLPSVRPEHIQNNAVHLCDSCQYTFPTCPSYGNDVVFGDGKGYDNICACNKYRPISAQPHDIARDIATIIENDKEQPDASDANRGDIIYRQAAIDAFEDTTFTKNEIRRRLSELPSAQPDCSFEIQDILDYLDTVLHPIISPEHWNVYSELHDMISTLPSAQPDMAENLYPYKCYITDEDGLQHEVIHTGDIRRVTGWEI